MNHIYTKDNENLEIEISKLLKLETSESLRCLILELLDENLKSIQFYCKDLEEIDRKGLSFLLSLAHFLHRGFPEISLSCKDLSEDLYRMLCI
ncbi:hypothetical protein MJH12_12335, partial [bacterium]|nr:hypothetical protein [bacterium]